MNEGKQYEFGRFRVDVTERLLFDGLTTISLPPKIFDTLLLLVENQGRALAKEEMMNQIWSDSFVEENNLAQNISVLRKTFGDDANFIETVPKRGYRFVAPVRIIEDKQPEIIYERIGTKTNTAESDSSDNSFNNFLSSPAVSPIYKPETRYAQNGDVNIASKWSGRAILTLFL